MVLVQDHPVKCRICFAGLCSGSLVSMSASKSALEALAMMHKYDVSAVAVVDASGRLMGSFSMSAMRSIVAEHFGALALPVAEFLALAVGEPATHGAFRGMISCRRASHSNVSERLGVLCAPEIYHCRCHLRAQPSSAFLLWLRERCSLCRRCRVPVIPCSGRDVQTLFADACCGGRLSALCHRLPPAMTLRHTMGAVHDSQLACQHVMT